MPNAQETIQAVVMFIFEHLHCSIVNNGTM